MIPGQVAVKRVDVDFPSNFVPRWGLYCGPGWSAGQANANLDYETMKAGEVLQVRNAVGKFEDSNLDLACKEHDLAYKAAEGRPDEAKLIMQADIQLISRVANSYSSLEPIERPYAAMVFAGFVAKLPYDGVSLLTSGVKSQINEILSDILEGSTPQDPFIMIYEGSIKHSIGSDSEGNIVLSRSDEHELMQLTFDSQLTEATFIQQQRDESGRTVESTAIYADRDSSTFELAHTRDAVEDLRGVIVGPITQEKLDQFSELGSLALNLPKQTDIPTSDINTVDMISRNLFKALDVQIPTEDLHQFHDWFNELDPILIEPYLWEAVDTSLQNFWNFGNDDTLAAFDLGGIIDDTNWRDDFWADDWMPPAVDPWFGDLSVGTDFSIPDPVFDIDFFSGDSGSFSGDSSFSDGWFSFIDPLVLKIGGGSVHTTNLSASKVMFDMDGDGKKEKTGWITADHAFLVRDKNNNGKIDGISEMFSEKMSPTAHTGFGALAELDTKRNGRIDKNDKAFADLRLWTDINANGITDAGELHMLSRFGIQSIDLNQTQSRNQYDNGNMVLSTASFTGERKGKSYTGEVAEVLFNFGDHAPIVKVYLSDQASALRTADGKVIERLHDDVSQKANASLSGVNVLIGEAGDVLNAGNAGQSLLIGNGGSTLNGNSGSVHFIVNGSQNIVNTGKGLSLIEVFGDANTINANKGDVELRVDGSRNKITIGSGAEVDLGGTANTLTAAAKSKDNEISVSGADQIINVSKADITLLSNASVALSGKDNDILMTGSATLNGKATGGSLMVSGSGNVATLSDAFVALTEGAALTLTGSKQQVVLAGDASLIMNGNAKDSTIHVFGDGNHLSANKAKINLDNCAGLELMGSGGKIILTGDATFKSSGTGHVIDVYRTDNELQVDRSTVNEHGLADLTLIGVGNALKVTKDTSPVVPYDMLALGKIDQALDQIWLTYEHHIEQISGLHTSSSASVGMIATLIGTDSVDGQFIPAAFT